MRPSKQQASLQARELVGVGHRFGKVGVLAIMPSQMYAEKLEWTSNPDRLNLNGRLAQIHFNLIGRDIVAFLCRKLGNFCKTQKSEHVQTHKTQLQPSSWHTGYNPSVSTCGPLYETWRWHLS